MHANNWPNEEVGAKLMAQHVKVVFSDTSEAEGALAQSMRQVLRKYHIQKICLQNITRK